MDSEKLQMIAALSAKRLPILIAEAEEEIMEAIARVTAEAQHHDKEKLVFKLTHSIELDLGKSKQRDGISFGVRVKHQVAGALPDPSNPELGLDDRADDEDE